VNTWGGSSIPEGYPDPVTEVAGLREYIAIVRRHIWLVLAIVGAALGITLYLVMTAPPKYRAVAVVRLADTRRALTGGSEDAAYTEVLSRETDLLQSQMQVLTSRGVAGDAVDREGLRFAPVDKQKPVPEISRVQVASDARNDTLRFEFRSDGLTARGRDREQQASYGQPFQIAGVSLEVSSRPKFQSAVFHVIPRDDAIDWLLGGFRGIARPKTDIIDLSFVSLDPRTSQRVVNAMVLAFQVRNATSAQQASRRRRIFLEEQMRQTDAMLQRAMNDYSGFRSRQRVFSSKEKATAQEQGLVTVEMRRAELDGQRRMYESLLAQAQRSGQGGDTNLRALVSAPGIAANPVVQQLYGRLASYETARDSLITSGAAQTNPDIVALNTLISSTNNKLVAAIRNQMQALQANIASLDNMKAASSSAIAAAPSAETEEAQLGQQVQAVQRIADQLQEDYQRAKMAEAVEVGQVEIVDLADVPTFPVATGRTRKLAMGLILGLMLGFGAAVVVDGMNTSITRRDEVERVLQVPGLGVIPRFAANRAGRARVAKLIGNWNGKRRNGQRAEGLITVHDARSSSAEAFRTLRTNLIFSQAVQTLRTIVVTSPSPGEGKTTTAANLAVSFAQQGMRVLIMDCDLRRARLHKVFRVNRSPGFTEYVLGQATLEEAVRSTDITGLYVMPSGPLPPNPSELLGGERMRKALTSLSEAYDMLMLDTPPLLAASDAAILSTLADGVVLVVRAGSTESEAGQQAVQQLSAVGARIVGAVLNDPDSKLPQYSGYYKYEYAAAES